MLGIFSVYNLFYHSRYCTDIKETYLLGTLEAVFGRQRDSDKVLVRIDERVGDRDDGWVVERQRDSSNCLDARQEAVDQLLLINIKNLGRENIALVKDLHNSHSVRERRDAKHVEKRCFGRSDTGTSSDDLDVGHDFNGTTSDLGRDTESLEEGGLSGLHTGVASRDGDILGREGTSTSGGGDLVGDDEVTDILEFLVSEDEANVALDVGEETLELGVVAEDGAQSTADHGVFAH